MSALAAANEGGVNGVALTVLIFFFVIVAMAGFWAARWRRPTSMESLDEWGLGGRSFGTWVTWFLLGGDLYTAYTFVAVPAAMWAFGAVNGFFAVPYTIILYPIIFIFMSRLWSVSHRHGYVTPADFVAGPFRLTRALARGRGHRLPRDDALHRPAARRHPGRPRGRRRRRRRQLGRQGPAALHRVPRARALHLHLGSARAGDHRVRQGHPHLHRHHRRGHLPALEGRRLGTRLRRCRGEDDDDDQRGHGQAQRLHPRSGRLLGVRHARPRLGHGALHVPALDHGDPLGQEPQHDPQERLDPAGLLLPARPVGPARLGGHRGRHEAGRARRQGERQLVIPQLFEDMFPSWFAGVAFAAIAIGALVPAAIMSIAAANTFTRNIYKAWLKPDATAKQEAQVSKITSLVVKAFALVFVLTLDKSNAINFQLLGGIWILQTFPALVFYLYTRWFHRWALLAGWAVGMVYGTLAAYNVTNQATGAPFAGSVANMPVIGQLGYIAVTAFAFNVVVAAILTLVLRAAKAPEGEDATVPADYFADAGDPRVEKLDVGPHEMTPSA